MHLSRRSLRQTTWMILAVWLFALGAGVANACSLNVPNDSIHSSVPVAHQHTPGTPGHHDEQPEPNSAGCLKFCDEASLAITKVDQPIAHDPPGSVGMLYRAWGLTVASTTAVRFWAHAHHRPAHLALPMAARPHRLTL
jgi:hypothetical protein